MEYTYSCFSCGKNVICQRKMNNRKVFCSECKKEHRKELEKERIENEKQRIFNLGYAKGYADGFIDGKFSKSK